MDCIAKLVQAKDIGAALERELTIYTTQVQARVNKASADAAEQLRAVTRATAPKKSGDYRRKIAVTEQAVGHGVVSYIWHVKSPEHRLTHLLVHGHALPNGRRTKAHPFLHNAWRAIQPAYEAAVKEAIKP